MRLHKVYTAITKCLEWTHEEQIALWGQMEEKKYQESTEKKMLGDLKEHWVSVIMGNTFILSSKANINIPRCSSALPEFLMAWLPSSYKTDNSLCCWHVSIYPINPQTARAKKKALLTFIYSSASTEPE